MTQAEEAFKVLTKNEFIGIPPNLASLDCDGLKEPCNVVYTFLDYSTLKCTWPPGNTVIIEDENNNIIELSVLKTLCMNCIYHGAIFEPCQDHK